MNRITPLGLRGLIPVLFLVLAFDPGVVRGQEATDTVTFAAYYVCSPGAEARADEIMQTVMSPAFARHVEAGNLINYGWLAHRIGSNWRRASYFAAPNLEALITTRDEILDELRQEHPDEMTEFNQICGGHQDYIWSRVAGSSQASAPDTEGMVSLSSYFECDMARESFADILVAEPIAVVYDKYVASGRIASWGWMRHVMGGHARRLWTVRGPDAVSVLNAWGEMLQELNTTSPDIMKEFSSICGAHNDYLWNVVTDSGS